jgi:hypothetical protein
MKLSPIKSLPRRFSRKRIVIQFSILLALGLCLRTGWSSQQVRASSSLVSPWLDSDIGSVSAAGSAMNAGAAAAYPDNPVNFNTRTRRTRIDWILYSGNVSVQGAEVPDTRNLNETVCEFIGTSDDLGVRPSDHDPVEATFTLN